MKITKHIEEREITLEEFVRQKNSEPYSSWRQNAKALNFLMIFAGSPRVFVQSALEVAWTPEQAEAFIKENKLQKLHRDMEDRYVRETPAMISYLTVATYMRKGFFDLYKGLMKRIEDNRAFAAEHGYVRTVFGTTRKLIEVMLRGKYDDKEHGAHMRNLDNVCANTDIQNFEAGVINMAMVKLDAWLEETEKKTKLWNCVHDSADMYVHKSELKEVVSKIKEFFIEAIPELKGIPLDVDFDVCDLRKGDFYKNGRALLSVLQEIEESDKSSSS